MPGGGADSLVNARLVRTATAVFIGFAGFYVLLRSKNILAVDGAHRCLEVFRRQGAFFHGNNHMLYPVDVLVWTRLSAELGLRPNGPIQFFDARLSKVPRVLPGDAFKLRPEAYAQLCQQVLNRDSWRCQILRKSK